MQRKSATHHPPRRTAVWRGVVGCAVAYALVITALLSSVIQAEWAAQAAAGLLGEHCATDARAAGTDPAEPAGQPDDSPHCALCNLTACPAVLPIEPAIAFTVLAQTIAPAIGNDRNLIHWRGHPGKLPRGPPRAAIAA